MSPMLRGGRRLATRSGAAVFERLFIVFMIICTVGLVTSLSYELYSQRERVPTSASSRRHETAQASLPPPRSETTSLAVTRPELDAGMSKRDKEPHAAGKGSRPEPTDDGASKPATPDKGAASADTPPARVAPKPVAAGPDATSGPHNAVEQPSAGTPRAEEDASLPAHAAAVAGQARTDVPAPALRRAYEGPLISGVDRRPNRPLTAPPPGSDGRGIFVPSKIGLPVKSFSGDAWPDWPDVNQRNIQGTSGVAALTEALALVGQSRLRGVADALVRKGVAIAFGEPEEFLGRQEGALAAFHFSRQRTADGRPAEPPTILFNPQLLKEHPVVLAATLAHEGTHFQQYLDGELLDPGRTSLETEFDAWWNEAAFWDEVRSDAEPLDTPLAREAEFGYRTALGGEAALRNLLAAMEQ